jgi:two-component system response regulator AtoC
MDNILLVDDNKSTIDALEQLVMEKGFNCITAENAEIAEKKFKSNSVDLVITDMKLPGMSGLDLLRKIKNFNDSVPVIVITAFGSVEKAVEAVKLGAFDFITKPFTVEEIEIKITKAISTGKLTKKNKELSLENEYLRTELSSSFSEIIGNSDKIINIFNQIEKVASANSPVLILGESGTGKELVARAIHYTSQRKNKPFVKVNCAALSQSLLESELFGHERGAFTGALRTKPGRFEIAKEGTIFLDEIGEISSEVQVKLLRVLQEKEFERVGGTETLKMSARLITATNRNLEELVSQKKFREDLFYRLNVVPIRLPSLRERREDIPLLVNHFITKYSLDAKKKIKGITKEAIELLTEYDWPGNIRELENIIERAIVMTNHTVLNLSDFSPFFIDKRPSENYEKKDKRTKSLIDLVENFEKEIIIEILNKCNGNITQAAKNLNINRTTLRYKLEKYGLINTENDEQM